MAGIKQKAPTRLTGGAGFEFADQVAADFLAILLSGGSTASDGQVVRLDWEGRDSGWLLDDLVLGLLRSSGPGSLALSIKSHRALTRGGFPADFVHAAWALWLHAESNIFKEDRDLFGLATSELALSVRQAWSDLLTQAIRGDPARLAIRFSTPGQTGVIGRSLFESLRCPPDLTSLGLSDSAVTVRLLRHLRLLPFDFRSPESRDLERAQATCQRVLQDGQNPEAARLWRTLVQIAAEHRTAGGVLDLSALLTCLRHDFALKDFPDYATDWEKLDRHSRQARDGIQESVVRRITLRRTAVADRLDGALRATAVVVLLGESGAGKSALAKHAADHAQRALWLDSESLDVAILEELEGHLRLRHPLSALLSTNARPHSLLIFDGMDRFSPRALARSGDILRSLWAAEPRPDWRVIVTAQLGREDDLRRELTAANVPAEAVVFVPVGLLAPEELGDVLAACPELRPVAVRPELRDLLRNLKVLDWIADELSSEPQLDTRGWLGLSNLVDHLWSRWTGSDTDSYARSGMLKKLARIEAEAFVPGVGLSGLDTPEQQAIGHLQARGLLRVREERAYFQHDLMGDWARVRLLVEETPQDPARWSDLARWPTWHPALRLYGQRLLEHDANGAAAWLRVYESLSEVPDQTSLMRDLLLESIIFANRADLFDRLWPVLAAADGVLLGRLLSRFLHVATIPAERQVPVGDVQTAAAWSAHFRVPYAPFWPPVLRLLSFHREELPPLARRDAARACALWLQFAPSTWPWRREAAAVAIGLARQFQLLKAEGTRVRGTASVSAFEAALWAAAELPDEVAGLCLELSRRRPEPGSVATRAAARQQDERRRRAGLTPDSVTDHHWRGTFRAAFPDGPTGKVDPDFRKAVWGGHPLAPLIANQPEAAREIVLACVLEPPGYDYEDGLTYGFSNLGMVEIPDHDPPMYFVGPFLTFLQVDPAHGLDCLIRLVNQATLEWDRLQHHHAAPNDAVDEPRNRPLRPGPPTDTVEWLGDLQVYGWYRDRFTSSEILVSALMALEKWLYNAMDVHLDVTPHIAQILTQSRSVALLGVLVAVARRHPMLLEGPLQPLLRIWRLYDWDDRLVLDDHAWQIGLMRWTPFGEQVFELVRAWHTMPHRRERFVDTVLRLLFESTSVAAALAAARAEWAGPLPSLAGNDAEMLELLCARLDPANYHVHQLDERRFELRLEWPPDLAERTERNLSRSAAGMRQVTLPYRCRQLLDAGEPLSPEAAEQLWATLQQVEGEELDGELEQIAWQRLDALLAGIAVLLVLARDWLAQHPEREDWCARYSFDAFAATPPGFLDSGLLRPGFLAEIAVALLYEDRRDETARLLAARSAIGFGPNVTALLMRRAFRLRGALDEDFVRLQNLVVLYAAMPRLTWHAGPNSSTRRLVASWTLRLVERFVTQQIPASPLSWQRVEALGHAARRLLEQRILRETRPATGPSSTGGSEHDREGLVTDPQTTGRPLSGRRRPPSHPVLAASFDLSVLQAGFDWLPALSQAEDGHQRNSWVALYQGLLEAGVAAYRSGDDDHDTPGATLPYPSHLEYDLWLFARLAALIPLLGSAAERSSFWQPILDLAPIATRPVQLFLDRWLTEGPPAAPSFALFVGFWQEMIEYALDSPEWTGSHQDDLWSHLFGLRSASSFFTFSENGAELIRLLPLYARWASRFLSSPEAISSLAAFLQQPAAREFRAPGLVWLREPVKRLSDAGWTRHRLDDRLASLLLLCWADSNGRLAAQPDSGAAFRALLSALVERGTAAALELRDQIIRSRAAASPAPRV
jgi:hypothetical protein